MLLTHIEGLSTSKKTLHTINFFLIIALLSYGISGTLGFVAFSIAVILALASMWCLKAEFSKSSLVAYVSVAMLYWILFLRTAVSDSLFEAFVSMGPILPLAILPLFLFVLPPEKYHLSSVSLGRLSITSVLIVLLCLLLKKLLPLESEIAAVLPTLSGRYEGYHGNAVPFSLVLLGLGCLSIAGWRRETVPLKLLALVSFVSSVFIVAAMSQVRGVTVAAIVTIVFLLAFICGLRCFKRIFISASLVLILIAFFNGGALLERLPLPERATNSIKLFMAGELSHSDSARFELWELGIKAFQDQPLLGYGYLKRFDAIKVYNPGGNVAHFKHLHNDLITVSVAGGVLAALAGVALLISPLISWWVFRRTNLTALFLAASLSTTIASAALSNTVLFNDIMPSWVVFACMCVAYFEEPDAESYS